jgi:hypothetical protein
MLPEEGGGLDEVCDLSSPLLFTWYEDVWYCTTADVLDLDFWMFDVSPFKPTAPTFTIIAEAVGDNGVYKQDAHVSIGDQ